MRPLWVRVLLQIILGLVLALVVPLLGVVAALSMTSLVVAGARLYGVQSGMTLIMPTNAIVFLTAGAIAGALSWLIVRRPLDALAAAAVVSAIAIGTHLTPHLNVTPEVRWLMSVGLVINVVAVFAGCAIVAWLIQRRERRRSEAEAAA